MVGQCKITHKNGRFIKKFGRLRRPRRLEKLSCIRYTVKITWVRRGYGQMRMGAAALAAWNWRWNAEQTILYNWTYSHDRKDEYKTWFFGREINRHDASTTRIRAWKISSQPDQVPQRCSQAWLRRYVWRTGSRDLLREVKGGCGVRW